MAGHLYYPQSACSLKDIAQSFCRKPDSSDDFANALLRVNSHAANMNARTASHRPILIPGSAQAPSISLNELMCCPPEQQATLSQLSQYTGGAAVTGLANLLWDTRIPDAISDLNTFGGNGMGAALANSNAVLSAINEYDLANKHYEDLKNHRASPAMIGAAQHRAESAFRKMNQVFKIKSVNYLNTNTFNTRPAINAAGRQVWESIPVRDALDVQKLANFAKGARIVGPGFILLDGYLRTNKVYHLKKSNDPSWKKQAFVQSAAFIVGLIAGGLISAVLVATPLGLVIGLVIGGAAAVAADHVMAGFIEQIYDWVAK